MIKPYHGRIVIRLDDPKDLGIIVPMHIRRKQNKGIVYEVDKVSDFKVGDRVVFQPRKGLKFDDALDKPKALILEEDIVLILKKNGMKQLKGDRICVKKIELDKVTGSGIIIPDTVSNESGRGIVKWVGESDDAKRYELESEVLFNSTSGNDIEISGQLYLILSCKDVIAVI
ncbi:hypothetical protein JW865_09335 [Candidatus Bathyarchaeota archaeon]|nr:hypothetical protein [Candidatus Bathyarchaeota archaeon]